MIYAVIAGEKIVNVVEGSAEVAPELPGATLIPDPSGVAHIGGWYRDGQFVPPDFITNPGTGFEASSLSRSQLLRGLLRRGFITMEEAENDPMLLPAFLDDAFAALAPQARVEAIIEWKNATTFEKNHRLFVFVLPTLAERMGQSFDVEDLTAFFNEFAQI